MSAPVATLARMIPGSRINDRDEVKAEMESRTLTLDGMPTTLIGKRNGMS